MYNHVASQTVVIKGNKDVIGAINNTHNGYQEWIWMYNILKYFVFVFVLELWIKYIC